MLDPTTNAPRSISENRPKAARAKEAARVNEAAKAREAAAAEEAAKADRVAAARSELRALLLEAPEELIRALASGRQRNMEVPWRRVELRPVTTKRGSFLQCITYDERQAFTQQIAWEDAPSMLDGLLQSGFANWHVETVGQTVQVRVTKKGTWQVHRETATRPAASLEVNRRKERLLPIDDALWQAIGVADESGAIKPTRRAKHRQVEEFVRVIDGVRQDAGWPTDRPLRVVDLGCGNAYLTFAAYRFLSGTLSQVVRVTGVDAKEQALQHNNALAQRLGWELDFVQGSIAAAPVDGADLVLALHACDTATDEALARAVGWRAPVILAAPCCHHDLQAQLRGRPVPEPYGLVSRHGIMHERLVDLLTDGLRAALLRRAGYRVDIIEFVASEHTPRNILLRAVYTGSQPSPEQEAEYASLVASWGVLPRLAALLEA